MALQRHNLTSSLEVILLMGRDTILQVTVYTLSQRTLYGTMSYIERI